MPFVIKNKTMPAEEELTQEKQQRLQEAIKQSDEGKVIPLEEFFSKMKQWLIK